MTQPENVSETPAVSTAPQAPVAGEQAQSGPDNGDAGRVPLLPSAVGEVDMVALAGLRAFHAGAAEVEPLEGDYVPSLLWPDRDAQKVRTDYPLMLYPPEPGREKIWSPLSEALTETLSTFAPKDDQARILRDNLPRLERIVRDALSEEGKPVAARAVLAGAGQALQGELELTGAHDEALRQDLDALEAALPECQLLGFSAQADLYLLRHAVYCELLPRRAAFHQEAARLANRLRGLLEVERDKSDEARSATALADDVGGGSDGILDLGSLSKQLGSHRGTVTMPAERRERIDRALQVLDSQGTSDRPLLMVVHQVDDSIRVDVPKELLSGETDDACGKASALFDAQAQVFAHVFRAMRVARLEIDHAYDPDRHDGWLAGFDWQAFSAEELLCLPVVAAVATDQQLAANGMTSLSRLLVSGRPVQVIARVQPGDNPGVGPGEDPLSGFRLELGYLGMSHREALINQCAAARPGEVAPGFLRALSCTRTGLHVIAAPAAAGTDPVRERLGPWLYAGASLDSRAHPVYRYDPGAGDSWAARFDFSGNPELEAEWPVYEQVFLAAGGAQQTLSLSFTFADFALLEPSYRRHFRLVPDACGAAEDLVPVDVYLTLDDDDGARAVPFVWAVDPQGQAHRLAISRALALATRDRLRFWRTLQELAGIKNEHVDRAIAEARAAIEAEAAAELERARAEHRAELERVRAETAGEAMGQLAAVLTGMDVASLGLAGGVGLAPGGPAVGGAAVAEVDPAAAEAAEVAPAAAEEEPEDDAFGYDEPMIDSMLCTSCNDCTGLNRLLFVYNGNKQAEIGDLSKGTFAQLVEAAEKCPARCIHPGKPQNPDEANLEALIKRAAPFN